MTNTDLMQIINDLEKKYPVHLWQIERIHIWPLIRIRLAFELYHKSKKGQAGNIVSARLRTLLNYVRNAVRYCMAYLADYRNNGNNSEPADIVFLSDGISFCNLNGYWYERFCDPIIEILKKYHKTWITLVPLHNYLIPRFSPSKFIQPILDVISCNNRIRAKKAADYEIKLENYEDFISYLKSNDLYCPWLQLPELTSCVARVKALEAYFTKALIKARPKAVFIVSYYCDEGMSMALACRRLGIPSVDIQHGFQGEAHVAYGSWNKVPENGYELLPSRFWCWDESDAQAIRNWSDQFGIWHKPAVVGNLWLKQWQTGADNLISGYDNHLLTLKRACQASVHVLVSLQFGLADFEILLPVLMEAKKLKPDWYWWIRLHPCRLGERKKIKALLQRNGIRAIDVDNATALPLYALLRHVDIHLTQCSSTVIEALNFKVPSVVTTNEGKEIFRDHILSGWARYASDATGVMEALEKQMQRAPMLKQAISPAVSSDPERLLLDMINSESSEMGQI